MSGKHHLYQIYYGGFKHKLLGQYYCRNCKKITTKKGHKPDAVSLTTVPNLDK